MTDPTAAGDYASAESENLDSLYEPKDWLLDGLIQIMSGDDSAMSLTIQSAGATITGTLISRNQYFSRLSEQMGDSGSPEMKDVIELWRTEMMAGDARDSERRANGGGLRSFHCIHMRDVKIMSGGTTLNAPLWRGTTEDITGWTLGNF
ncbi:MULTISPECIES: hypothetical protein [unclassified Microbacterium]|uniref:hypothetical protein n=1 Tax=unclassified Microbacterium TaxID=2609290 RepID=UPI0012FA2DEF|nr:hypothetical protein [Microbacterium sp. MAH-37]MVQ41399.1 hypothetical protein [Microbacterium sp. MAH-37]